MEYAVVSRHDLPGILQPTRAIVITNKACNMVKRCRDHPAWIRDGLARSTSAVILSSVWFAQMRCDSVSAATCKDDCLLKSKQHFSREKPTRMSSNDSPPPPVFSCISVSTCCRGSCSLSALLHIAMETRHVIKNILPPLAIHLLLSIRKKSQLISKLYLTPFHRRTSQWRFTISKKGRT